MGTLATLTVRLIGDASGLKDSLSKAERMTSSFSSGLKTAGAIGVGALGLIGGAAVGVGIAAFGMANDIQTANANIKSSLGTTAEETERLGSIAQDVWVNNFGGSITEAGNILSEVQKQLGEMSDNELQDATENVFRLGDSFPDSFGDATKTINTAKTLMEEFDLTQQEAFDFMAKGAQMGLDANGDFLDSIGEYSNLFADGQGSAGEFFSLLETGMAGGMLGTDKAADLYKEFSLRIKEGGDDARKQFEMMGVDFDQFMGSLRNGDMTAVEAFDNMLYHISQIEDPLLQNQAGVALMGTQFEDLGASAVLGIDLATTSLEDMGGATDSLDAKYNNLADIVEGFKRRGLKALMPISKILLDVGKRIMPLVERGFAFFETSIVPAIELGADTIQSFISNLEEGMSPMNAFIEAIWDIAPPEVLDFLIRLRDEILPQLMAWFESNVQPILNMAIQFVSWKDVLIGLGIAVMALVLPALASLIGTIVTVAAPILAVIAIVSLLRTAWENNWGGIRDKTQEAWAVIKPLLDTARLWLEENIPVALAFLQARWEEVWPLIKNAIDAVWGFVQPNILEPLQAWLEEKIPAALETLRTFWVDDAWPAIKAGVVLAWLGFKIFLKKIEEFFDNLPDLIDIGKQAWEAGWTAMKRKVDTVKQPIEKFFDAIRGFADWLSGHVFDFSFELPELPDWAIPGSPIPLHTAWKNFGQDMKQMRIQPQMDLAQVSGPPANSQGGGMLPPVTIHIDARGNENAQEIADKSRDTLLEAYRRLGVSV